MEFRKVSKILRMHLTHAIYEKMTEGASDLQKTLLGNVIGLRYRMASSDIVTLSNGDFDRSRDQLMLFEDVFGENNNALPAESKLLEAATDFLISKNMEDAFEVTDVTIEYRTSAFELPLIKSFSIRGTGMHNHLIADFHRGS